MNSLGIFDCQDAIDHSFSAQFERFNMSIHSLSFAAQITDLPGLTNAEFLQRSGSNRSANAAVRKAAASGDVTAFIKAWQANRRDEQAGFVTTLR